MAFIIIYVTHETMENAKNLAAHLLDKRLIACANFFPIESSCWWKGKIENSMEVVSLLKTKKENWLLVKAEIKKLHPYETPAIIKLDAEANEDYEAWINKEAK
jgi:periplasmic divalent cation tolerance protein